MDDKDDRNKKNDDIESKEFVLSARHNDDDDDGELKIKILLKNSILWG